jgi:phage recombination protein Bet
MSTVATRTQGTALTLQDGQTEFTSGQVATLRQLGVENATREDLAVFFHQAVRTGLDPFARQIYMIGRWTKQGTKQTIQTGIDGYRLIARRAADKAGESLGYEDTLWCGEDGAWRDVWISKTAPAAAKVTVLRNGERFSAVALFSEYAGTTKDGSYTQMWATKGAIMIAKCAEALALRKAYPQDLSGIYTAEEMAQADNDTRAAAVAPAPKGKPASRVQQAMNADPEPAPMEDLGERVERDWLEEAGELTDVDALRALWLDAQAAGAEQGVLDSIRLLATPADEPAA